MLALLGAHHILHVSRIRVKENRILEPERLLDRPRWRSGITRGHRPVVRQTTVQMSDTNTEQLQLLIILQLIFTQITHNSLSANSKRIQCVSIFMNNSLI